jgi:hypothetical protein
VEKVLQGASGIVVPLPFPSAGFCLSFGSRELQSRSKGLEGDKTDSGLEFSTAAEGRHKPPPSLHKCFIAHVEGGAAAHISSMTSSWFDLQSEREGRDEELKVPLCLVCGWTMNSWVFGSISLLAKVSLRKYITRCCCCICSCAQPFFASPNRWDGIGASDASAPRLAIADAIDEPALSIFYSREIVGGLLRTADTCSSERG